MVVCGMFRALDGKVQDALANALPAMQQHVCGIGMTRLWQSDGLIRRIRAGTVSDSRRLHAVCALGSRGLADGMLPDARRPCDAAKGTLWRNALLR